MAVTALRHPNGERETKGASLTLAGNVGFGPPHPAFRYEEMASTARILIDRRHHRHSTVSVPGQSPKRPMARHQVEGNEILAAARTKQVNPPVFSTAMFD